MVCADGRCRISGDVTVDTAGGLLRDLQPELARGATTLDFSEVGAADSAALALIFSAMRAAAEHRRTLTCTGMPASFTTLAELYGVSALLPV